MRSTLIRLWSDHKILTLAFGTALCVTVFFGVRLALFSLYWADPDHHRQALEDWMTPRYVAHSYHLPPEDVMRALSGGAEVARRPTLADLSEITGQSLDDMQAVIAAMTAEKARP
ncbi:hypothetical protein [Pseudogemmobacter sp. W21_MBD1_M6]|uniref:hypothetical protein n=1 Tax=Pseudogemmobacter sp. W21_MBD1_M6 TaxID=3240271 RepID=UPI003F97FC6D